MQPPRREQPGQAGVSADVSERLDLGHQQPDAPAALGPAPDQILAVERRHADAGLHAIAFGQVFEPDPGPDVGPAETGLAHDGWALWPAACSRLTNRNRASCVARRSRARRSSCSTYVDRR